MFQVDAVHLLEVSLEERPRVEDLRPRHVVAGGGDLGRDFLVPVVEAGYGVLFAAAVPFDRLAALFGA